MLLDANPNNQSSSESTSERLVAESATECMPFPEAADDFEAVFEELEAEAVE